MIPPLSKKVKGVPGWPLIGFRLRCKIHEVDICYHTKGFKSVTKVSVEALIKWKFPLNIVSLFIGGRIENRIIKQIESELIELKEICESC